MGTRVKHMARRLAGIVAVGLVAVSCGRDATTSPSDVTQVTSSASWRDGGGSGDRGGLLGGLLSCTPLPEAHASAWIGREGGTLHVGPHTFTVPAGALDRPVFISADAPSGHVNLVQFEPEGLHFERAASLTMSFANCSLLVRLLPQIAYVDDGLHILDYIPSLAQLLSKTVTGRVSHFSGYAVAW